MAEKRENIPDQLAKIREYGGSVNVDGKNITADSDTERGALSMFAHFAPNSPIYEKMRETLDDAIRETTFAREINARNDQGGAKIAAHPRIFMQTDTADFGFEMHRCRNKKCCAED